MQLPTPSQAPRGLLPKGSQLRGEINVAQGLRIEGEIHGNVRAMDGDGATVIVAEGATVVGAIEAAHVVVQGQVQGPVVARQSLHVQAGAQIEGALHYLHLDLHPQALVRGSLNPMLGLMDDANDGDAPAEPAPARDAEPAGVEAQANGPDDDADKSEAPATSGDESVPSPQTHVDRRNTNERSG